jgi:hypothetical protein
MALFKPKKQYPFGAIAEFDDGHNIYRTTSFQAQIQVNSTPSPAATAVGEMRNCAKRNPVYL